MDKIYCIEKIIDKIYIKNNTLIIELQDYIESLGKLKDLSIIKNHDNYSLYLQFEKIYRNKFNIINSSGIREIIPNKYYDCIKRNNFDIFLIYKENNFGYLIKNKMITQSKNYTIPCSIDSNKKEINDFLIFLDNQEIKYQIV